jgi:hypothetical protein
MRAGKYIIPLLLKNYVNILDMFFPCISDTVDIFGKQRNFQGLPETKWFNSYGNYGKLIYVFILGKCF